MDDLARIFREYDPVDLRTALVAITLAFALSQALGLVYMKTFQGMSYSRSYVQSVALGSIVVCMLMLAINHSVASGLGVAGGLSMVRFRTAMRDPRDMVFVFASLGAGIAAGLRAYEVAILGTVFLCLATLALSWIGFGSTRDFDGLLRLQLPAQPEAEEELARILRAHTRHFIMVTLRDVAQGRAMEHAYQVSLPEGGTRTELLKALGALPGVQDVTLMMQEQTVEL